MVLIFLYVKLRSYAINHESDLKNIYIYIYNLKKKKTDQSMF